MFCQVSIHFLIKQNYSVKQNINFVTNLNLSDTFMKWL